MRHNTPAVLLLLAALTQGCDRSPTLAPATEPDRTTLIPLVIDNGSGEDFFDTNTLTSYNIHNTPGAWSVQSGQLVGNGSAQQSVVVRKDTNISDGWVETVTSQVPDGGLVLRFYDVNNYYLLAIRDDSRYGHANLEFYKQSGGVQSRITTQRWDISWPAGTQKTVRFEAVGTSLRAYVNGSLVAQVTDATFYSGAVGMRHNSAAGENLTSKYDLFRWNNFRGDLFNENSLGSYTLYNTPGAWSVQNDQLVSNATAQQSVAIRNGVYQTSGYVETASSQIPDGGLVLRFVDADNYYLLAVRDDSRYGYANLEFYRVVGGVQTRIGNTVSDIYWPAGVRRTVRFEALGSSLRAYVDGMSEAEVWDETFTAGGVGLRHNSAYGENLTSRFDLFRWSN